MPKTAVCKKEPRGEYGLEGFERDKEYYYERFDHYKHKMVRIFPNGCFPNDKKRYYEIATKNQFDKFFNPK